MPGTIAAPAVRTFDRGQLSRATARRFRADLAAVSDSFLIRLNEAMRFGTVSGGKAGMTLLPPAGIPVYVVCEPAGAQLTCRNLNGDENVAVGSAIYSALPSKKWRRAPAGGGEPPSQATGRMMNAIFGHLTPAEWRLVIDLARPAGTTAHSSHASGRSAG